MAKVAPLVLFGILALLAAVWASPLSKGTESSNSSEESGEVGEMLKELQEMCKNNSGSDAAFLGLMSSVQETMVCAVASLDLEGLMTDVDTLSNETRFTFFPRYCPQLRKTYSCVNKLVGDVRPCLEDDDYTIVQALVGILPDAVELMCKNDGEILFKYDEPKYSDCLEKLGDSFEECTNSFLNSTDDWDLSNMTQDQCSTMFGFRDCLQGKLGLCKASDLISVYDLFHNTLVRMTPCRNYVEVPKVTLVDNNTVDED
ncbi:27 kDa hemolymph glycoprotein-like [Anopheles nili]|uniref:27 kDa hemolymph glycoprotein-like n=1 Tax=Anopheles nili TaxID=185578 RepID=UPI00237A5D54|nr:27 kDa hemolymph glycoprotein-like [Anopheles nili]